MPKFPVVDNNGCFDHETVLLTKSLLGFYVKNHSPSQVTAYADGLWDACTLIENVISESSNESLTLEQFRQQIQQIISERYELMTTMHSYVSQTRAERTPKNKLT